jgi:hypothetical protein
MYQGSRLFTTINSTACVASINDYKKNKRFSMTRRTLTVKEKGQKQSALIGGLQ